MRNSIWMVCQELQKHCPVPSLWQSKMNVIRLKLSVTMILATLTIASSQANTNFDRTPNASLEVDIYFDIWLYSSIIFQYQNNMQRILFPSGHRILRKPLQPRLTRRGVIMEDYDNVDKRNDGVKELGKLLLSIKQELIYTQLILIYTQLIYIILHFLHIILLYFVVKSSSHWRI